MKPIDKRLLDNNPTIHRISEYVNINTKMEVGCYACGHKWWVIPKLVSRTTNPTKCPNCNRKSKMLTISELKTRLQKQNIFLVDENQFVSVNNPISLRCNNGHNWVATPSQYINNNSHCPICINANIKYDINDINNKLPQHITCEDYNGMNTTSSFVCNVGHRFKCTPSNIIHQRHFDCPVCNPYSHNCGFGKTTVYNEIIFKSMLECRCYQLLENVGIQFNYQHPYAYNARKKCDFYVVDLCLWIEVSSFTNEKYLDRIKEKRRFVEQIGETFIFASSVDELIIKIQEHYPQINFEQTESDNQ